MFLPSSEEIVDCLREIFISAYLCENWNEVQHQALSLRSANEFSMQKYQVCQPQIAKFVRKSFEDELNDPEKNAVESYFQRIRELASERHVTFSVQLGAQYLFEADGDITMPTESGPHLLELLRAYHAGACILEVVSYVCAYQQYSENEAQNYRVMQSQPAGTDAYEKALSEQMAVEIDFNQHQVALQAAIGHAHAELGQLDKELIYKIAATLPLCISLENNAFRICNPHFAQPVRPEIARALRKAPTEFMFEPALLQ